MVWFRGLHMAAQLPMRANENFALIKRANSHKPEY
jgi:hypothetical protein